MNALVNQVGENVAEFRAPGPGERLRAARLSLGLELPKLAGQLHLSDSMVVALERDDYEALPGRVFIRGYLRNYAKLVGVPADSVVKQFDERVPDTEGTRRLHRVGASVRREVHSSHGLVRLLSLLIVLGLAALFFLWWDGHMVWPEQDGARLAGTVNAPAAPIGAEGQLSLPQLAPTAPPPAAAEPEAIAGGNEAASVAEAPVTPDQATAAAPDPQALQAPDQVPAASLPASPAPVVAQRDIVFEFSAPCWVDVRDASRGFKLVGEMEKGARKVLGGAPPYKVVIGDASAVRITIAGAPYDIARHTRGNVARFTLDPAGASD